MEQKQPAPPAGDLSVQFHSDDDSRKPAATPHPHDLLLWFHRAPHEEQGSAASSSSVTHSFGRVAIAGAGFAADAYDLFVINMVLRIMAAVYPQSVSQASFISSTALAGAVAGQIIFGGWADYVGRRALFITTMVLVIVGTLGSSLIWDFDAFSIYTWLGLWRLVLGFGVGGEYPLSATVTAETSTIKERGRNMTSVFAMQGVGCTLAALVTLVCLRSGMSLDSAWRVSLAMGALPALLSFYGRMKMHETTKYLALSKNVPRTRDRGTVSSHKSCGIKTKHLLEVISVHKMHLLGTAGSWLIFDVMFYGNSLFSATITKLMGLGDTLPEQAANVTVLALLGVPGYALSIIFIDSLGRKQLQLLGFSMLALLYGLMGLWFEQLKSSPGLFLVLYGLTFLFSNFGPNATTYVIPGELFPTSVRATCTGISAASGKAGAMIGAAMLPAMMNSTGVANTLLVCGLISLAGVVWTVMFIPFYTVPQLEAQEAVDLASIKEGSKAP